SGSGRAQPRHLPEQNAPRPIVGPSLPDAQLAPAATPAADVLDSDRILELPPRRAPQGAAGTTELQRAPRMSNSSRPRLSTGMQPLREVTRDYLAGMPPRRGAAEFSASTAGATGKERGSSGKHTMPPDTCPICHGAGYVRLDVPLGDPAFGQAVRCE